MNWQDWPAGAESAEFMGFYREICPVCSTPLRPVELHFTSKPTYYSDGMDVYTAICPHCRTKYLRTATPGSVIIDPNEERIIDLEDTVKALNARISNLEDVIRKLIAYIRQADQREATKQIPEHRADQREAKQEEVDDFTRKYHHLL